jgi:post-segregation antitoxin (ccd killing protein)
MKLINVRLGTEDARLAARLRKDGIQISRVVREAIRAAYHDRVEGRPRRRRPSEIMAEIYAALPDPPGLPPRRYDLRDPSSVRRQILARRRLRRP